MNIKAVGIAVLGSIAAIGFLSGNDPAHALSLSFKATTNTPDYSDFTFSGNDLNSDGYLSGSEISSFSGLPLSNQFSSSGLDEFYDVLGQIVEFPTMFSRFSLTTLSWESTFDGGVSFAFPDDILFDTSDGSAPSKGVAYMISSAGWTYAPEATPVPTPALLPGLVGMGVATLRKRKQEKTEAVAEA